MLAAGLIAGVGRPRLNLAKTAALPIPLPPTSEQERIVAAVEEQFSRLDAGVAALERARRNLKRMRGAVLRAAVISAERLGATNVALSSLVGRDRKIAYGVLVPGDDIDGGVPFVRVGDLADRRVNLDGLKRISPAIAARYPRTRLQGGEVLLSVVGTIGRAAVAQAELAGANVARALAVIPVNDNVDPHFLAVVLSTDQVTEDLTALAHEVARKTLNLEDVRRYPIPMLDHHHQIEIVAEVEQAETWLSQVQVAIASSRRRSDLLRSSILAAAFSGKLVSQNPSDEPASVLLERIATEHAGRSKPTRTRKPRTPSRQKASS